MLYYIMKKVMFGLYILAIVLAITALEMAVALIQAYIFSLLTVIYLNETVDLH